MQTSAKVRVGELTKLEVLEHHLNARLYELESESKKENAYSLVSSEEIYARGARNELSMVIDAMRYLGLFKEYTK